MSFLNTENNGCLVVTKKFFHSETHYVSARTGPSSDDDVISEIELFCLLPSTKNFGITFNELEDEIRLN